eukprot:3977509-Pyramimonas_sp.AAC.1
MAGLQYIGGGIAMSRRRLDDDRPAAPAPGVLLNPPRVTDGRFASTGLKRMLNQLRRKRLRQERAQVLSWHLGR